MRSSFPIQGTTIELLFKEIEDLREELDTIDNRHNDEMKKQEDYANRQFKELLKKLWAAKKQKLQALDGSMRASLHNIMDEVLNNPQEMTERMQYRILEHFHAWTKQEFVANSFERLIGNRKDS